ncbi:Ku protein [Streptomyces flaveus]|uniref:non-homologous end joining protein Ku n=1 Tax=Streptomyces flaveus TaxID=66370 RepID=UPI003330FF5A
MATIIATTAVSFGLVSVPVQLSPATEEHRLPLHEVHLPDSGRIRHRRFCEREDREVPYAEVGRGLAMPDGTVAALAEADLERLPLPSRHRMDVLGFVHADEVDPILYRRAYYAHPASLAAERPYEVLVAALARTGLVGIAKGAIRSRERLVVLRPRRGVLVAHTIYWPDEVREPGPAPATPVTDREMELAELLLNELRGVDATDVRDDYEDALQQLAAALTAGRELAAAAEPEGPPVDLMAALQASVRAAQADLGAKS